jgi:hypothetical protein
MSNAIRFGGEQNPTAEAVEEGTVERAKYARFFWPALRGITLIVTSYGLIAFLSESLHPEYDGVGWLFFVFGSIVLPLMITPPYPYGLPAIVGEPTEPLKQRQIPWFLLAYCVITGAGFNWTCVFLAFSRHYAFFSVPVIVATGFVMAVYAAIGLLVATLKGGGWRRALEVFALASALMGLIAFRWRLFR